MVRPVRAADVTEVVYDQNRWRLFEEFRKMAFEMMRPLVALRLDPLVHGSVARGDVDRNSDVDVFISRVVPSYKVELALREAGFKVFKREIVIATPWQLPKAHVYIDENRSVTFPLVKPKRPELEFCNFGGAADLGQVKRGERTPGVDKRLMLIEPTTRGHIESPIVGREGEVAKRLGVCLEIVRERVQVLTRRVKIGHTGIFLQRALSPDEGLEEVFEDIVRRSPPVKLRLKESP